MEKGHTRIINSRIQQLSLPVSQNVIEYVTAVHVTYGVMQTWDLPGETVWVRSNKNKFCHCKYHPELCVENYIATINVSCWNSSYRRIHPTLEIKIEK